MKHWRIVSLLSILTLVALSCATSFGQDQPIVHLRYHAGEPYLDRALELPREQIVFTSVWPTRKYYPQWPADTNSGDPTQQAGEVRREMKKATDAGFAASPGFGLHPIKWLDKQSWQMRANALEEFIVAGDFQGMDISIDIEGYGYVEDGKRTRVAPPRDEEAWSDLIEACSPVRYVVLKYRMRPTIYPAGGRKFDHYVRAAMALGATKFGDEYSFVWSTKLRQGHKFTNEEWKWWIGQLTNTDPQDRGIHFIPGFFTSNFPNGSVDRLGLTFMGVNECWLFVDDKTYLQQK